MMTMSDYDADIPDLRVLIRRSSSSAASLGNLAPALVGRRYDTGGKGDHPCPMSSATSTSRP